MLALLLDVRIRWDPFALLGVILLIVLGAAVFSTFSLIVACLVKTRERFMGVGQVLTMPLFFASNAIYPTSMMPGWLQVVSHLNPLTYQVDGLRALLWPARRRRPSVSASILPCWLPRFLCSCWSAQDIPEHRSIARLRRCGGLALARVTGASRRSWGPASGARCSALHQLDERAAAMHAADRFGEQGGDGYDPQFGAGSGIEPERRHGIGYDQLFEGRIRQQLNRFRRE